jgi:hypothetical protein
MLFPGLSSFPRFERDPCAPIFMAGEAQERPTAQGALCKENNPRDTIFDRTPCTLDRVPSIGLPSETMRRMLPSKGRG